MGSNNLDELTKEYIKVVNEMTTCMMKLDSLKNQATERRELHFLSLKSPRLMFL